MYVEAKTKAIKGRKFLIRQKYVQNFKPERITNKYHQSRNRPPQKCLQIELIYQPTSLVDIPLIWTNLQVMVKLRQIKLVQ